MFGFKKWRRKRHIKKPFPSRRKQIIEEYVPYARHLSQKKQSRLFDLISIFLKERRFEGCGDLKISEEIKVTIAAQACIMLLGSEDLSFLYDDLRSILVYPEPYVAKVKTNTSGYIAEEGFQQRHGEAWSRGYVVLAWSEVQKGAEHPRDGKNLIFHEFAHQLDYQFGISASANQPSGESEPQSLSGVIADEYQKLLRDLNNNKPSFIDPYGAKNTAELFAVCSVSFFEEPHQLSQHHPALYNQLKSFYRQDPRNYINS